MAVKALITMDDLEAAVRINAHFESEGHTTVLVSSLDDSVAILTDAQPDIVILTGALQEHPARALLTLARRRSIQTLGLIEAAAPNSEGAGAPLTQVVAAITVAVVGRIHRHAGEAQAHRRRAGLWQFQ